jgi:hypothetical protein
MNLARVVNSKKPKDFTEQLDAMQKHWESGVKLLLPARVSRSRSQ